MLILIVNIKIKTERIADFSEAISENAKHSRLEPGVARFDVVQQTDDPSRFVLYEVYRDSAAMASHKEQPHYLAWLAKADDMFAEPRTRAIYQNVSPADEGF